MLASCARSSHTTRSRFHRLGAYFRRAWASTPPSSAAAPSTPVTPFASPAAAKYNQISVEGCILAGRRWRGEGNVQPLGISALDADQLSSLDDIYRTTRDV